MLQKLVVFFVGLALLNLHIYMKATTMTKSINRDFRIAGEIDKGFFDKKEWMNKSGKIWLASVCRRMRE